MGVCGCLTLYAAGWDNPEVKDACGKEADRFQLGTFCSIPTQISGNCQIGRAFLCMGLGAFVLCLCSVLSICGGRKEKFSREDLIRGYDNTRLDLAK